MQYDERKPRFFRRFLFCVVIAVCALIQNLPAEASPFSVRALLVIPATVCISVFEREIPSALFGFFGGMLLDISSSKDGFNTLVLTVLCAAVSLLVSHFMRNNIVTAAVMCGSSVIVYQLIYIIVFYIFGGAGFPVKAILSFCFPCFALTFLFIPILYFIIMSIGKKFETAD